jgi:hypothetical protein
MMNFSITPDWLFKTSKLVAYPATPNQFPWEYTQRTELRNPAGKEMSDYYGRSVSWYVNWGFTNERGLDTRINQPDVRFWLLKPLKDSLHPGGTRLETALDGSLPNDISAQAFLTQVRSVKRIDSKMKLEPFAVTVVSW